VNLPRANAAMKAAIAVVTIAAFCLLHSSVGLTARPQDTVHTVVIEGMKFVPDTITVARGDTVVWINKDFFPHTVTATGGRFDSHEIEAAKSWKFVSQKDGKFGYLCTLHPAMKGMLVVK
jgi:plastocyanin